MSDKEATGRPWDWGKGRRLCAAEAQLLLPGRALGKYSSDELRGAPHPPHPHGGQGCAAWAEDLRVSADVKNKCKFLRHLGVALASKAHVRLRG